MPPEHALQHARDHGGNLDAAIRRFGGDRSNWTDLSTGINPSPYPVGALRDADWTALPDQSAIEQLVDAARAFWNVPQGAAILAAPGASALIARLPLLARPARVHITPPTYNEHAAAFSAVGWQVTDQPPGEARVLVHPNNPDGHFFCAADVSGEMVVIDESFCDVAPEHSLVAQTEEPGRIVLKSFGKFWGLAGLRLGFAIAQPATIARLSEMLGPWPVSGPALRIGTQALSDAAWAETTRHRLTRDREKLDKLMISAEAKVAGGTSLFGLYQVDNAIAWQERLARSHIWTRTFPYSDELIRLGLPPEESWPHLEAAL